MVELVAVDWSGIIRGVVRSAGHAVSVPALLLLGISVNPGKPRLCGESSQEISPKVGSAFAEPHCSDNTCRPLHRNQGWRFSCARCRIAPRAGVCPSGLSDALIGW